MVNKVFLVGHLGDAPQARAFPDGSMLSTASLATNEHWRDKQTNERVERTDWHRLVFHARLAEVAAQYLRKGSKIFVEGQLRTRKWQAEDGSDRYVTEVHVRAMEMLDKKDPHAHASPSSTVCHSLPPEGAAPALGLPGGGRVPQDGAAPANTRNAYADAKEGRTPVPAPAPAAPVQSPAVGSVPFCDQGVEDDDIPF